MNGTPRPLACSWGRPCHACQGRQFNYISALIRFFHQALHTIPSRLNFKWLSLSHKRSSRYTKQATRGFLAF
jgi:hypothetical protein